MKKLQINKDRPYNIAVFGLSGIGISLLTVPMLRALRKNLPHAKITYIVRFSQSKKLLEKCPYVDKILVCNLKEIKGIRGILGFLWRLRKQKFDISITCFPSNNRLKNIFSFLVGARYRITHKYKIKRFTSLSFLQNVLVDVDYKAHDVDQNLSLLMPLSVDTDNVDKSLSIYPEKDYEDFACGYLAGLDIKNDDLLVGMHPGSSEKFGMINRRWPVRYFAKLADMIIDKKKAKILVFGGPKEENLRNKLKELCKNKNDVIIVSSLGIDQVASLIKKCNLFISNDSGLMHLAAIQDIRTVGIFGPADPRRTGPYGNKHMVIRKGLECSPCWSLENIGRRFRCIKGSMECLESLGVDEVFDIIQKEIDLETLSKANKSLSKR